MLRHPEHGQELLEVRKALAFQVSQIRRSIHLIQSISWPFSRFMTDCFWAQGWTYKKPQRMVYDPRRGLELGVQPATGTVRGRSRLRVSTGSSFKRALSV